MIRTLPFLFLPLPAMAELKVVTDIAPIHSITAQIMGDIGTPTLLLPADADVHHFQFRPSNAQALQDADVVIMVGPALTPWLADPVESLTSEAAILSLAETESWKPLQLEMRVGHADHDDHDEHEGHDDHDEHADQALVDPHAWLNPAVASYWASEITAELVAKDPNNAATYQANLTAFEKESSVLDSEIARILQNAGPIIWPHDGYQYLEALYEINAVGRIADSHAATPGPDRISELQTLIKDEGVACILTDREINGAWVDVIRDGTNAGTAYIDNIGADLDPGPDLYPAMMRNLATAIADC